jgi:hypothetical protein
VITLLSTLRVGASLRQTRRPNEKATGISPAVFSLCWLRQREATMELSMRLNVLAALMSFGFIAAIVVGMV